MSLFIKSLIYFVSSFALVFLFYVVMFNKKAYKEQRKNVTEVNYLAKRFNLNMRKITYKKLLWIVTFVNALIVSFTFTVVANIESFVWSLLIGFAMMAILIYSLYEITGRILAKRGEKTK